MTLPNAEILCNYPADKISSHKTENAKATLVTDIQNRSLSGGKASIHSGLTHSAGALVYHINRPFPFFAIAFKIRQRSPPRRLDFLIFVCYTHCTAYVDVRHKTFFKRIYYVRYVINYGKKLF